jgi:hypothetical protein
MAAVAGARAATPLAVIRAAAPPPEPFPDRVRILVAGPRGGRMDRWAGVIEEAFARALPPETTLRQTLAGGADGVTAANQFETRVAPDGQTVLLLPGEAPLAWLTGDPRARFDVANWLPVMAGLTSGVLVSRVPASALRSGARLRVATSAPAGPELAALLGLHLMGIEPVPAFGLHDAAMSLQALRGRAVDAVFLLGPNVPSLLANAAAAGATPLFTLGVPTQSGLHCDPLLPEVPTALELMTALRGTPPTGSLAEAWRSAADPRRPGGAMAPRRDRGEPGASAERAGRTPAGRAGGKHRHRRHRRRLHCDVGAAALARGAVQLDAFLRRILSALYFYVTTPGAVQGPLTPNPSLRIDAALGIVIIEFHDQPGQVSSTIPTTRQIVWAGAAVRP